MTDQALDQLTRRLLLDAVRLEYAPLLESPPDDAFSPAFERRMKKLLRRAAHPVRYRFVQAAACAALVVVLSGCSVLAFSAEARAAFMGWVREVYASWSVYRYTGEAEQDVMDTPRVMPCCVNLNRGTSSMPSTKTRTGSCCACPTCGVSTIPLCKSSGRVPWWRLFP